MEKHISSVIWKKSYPCSWSPWTPIRCHHRKWHSVPHWIQNPTYTYTQWCFPWQGNGHLRCCLVAEWANLQKYNSFRLSCSVSVVDVILCCLSPHFYIWWPQHRQWRAEIFWTLLLLSCYTYCTWHRASALRTPQEVYWIPICMSIPLQIFFEHIFIMYKTK